MKARIPADVDMPDRILAGLTLRQIAVASFCTALIWSLFLTVGRRVPLVLFGLIAAPVAAAGVVLATVKPAGISPERLLVLAARHLALPKRRVEAPEGIPELPTWAEGLTERLAPIDTALRGVSEDGFLDLGPEGAASIWAASPLNFGMRSASEQEALVEGFGRFLNSLDGPVQFLAGSEPADLGLVISSMDEGAALLPHPGLTEAAREHASFLKSLAFRGDVLSRRILLCTRDPRCSTGNPALRLAHRIEEASAMLRGIGIRLARLDAREAALLLRKTADPEAWLHPAMCLPGEVVKGAGP